MAINTVDMMSLYKEVLRQISAITGLPIQGRLQNVVYDQMRYAFDGVVRMGTAQIYASVQTKVKDIDVTEKGFNKAPNKISVASDTGKIVLFDNNNRDMAYVVYNSVFDIPTIKMTFSQMMACKIILNLPSTFAMSSTKEVATNLQRLSESCSITVLPKDPNP